MEFIRAAFDNGLGYSDGQIRHKSGSTRTGPRERRFTNEDGSTGPKGTQERGHRGERSRVREAIHIATRVRGRRGQRNYKRGNEGNASTGQGGHNRKSSTRERTAH